MGRNNSLFPVSIRIANSQNHHDYNKLFIQSFLNGEKDSKGNIICFDRENLSCHIWNSQKEYYSCITPIKGESLGRIYFKNILVPQTHISDPEVFDITINLFGWDASEAMQLNREKLRNDFSISEIVADTKSMWKKMFAQNVDDSIQVIKNKYEQDNGYLWYACVRAMLSDKIMPAEVKAETLEKLLSLEYDYLLEGYRYNSSDEVYRKVQDISVKELVIPIYRNESVINIPLFYWHFDSFGKQSETFLNGIKESIVSFPIICNEPSLRWCTQDWDDKLVLYDEHGNVCFNVKTNKAVAATELDTNEFMKHLYRYIHGDDRRIIATNCVKPYDILALNLEKNSELPIEFYLSTNRSYFGFTSRKMLVPVTEYHIDKLLKDRSKSKEKFTNEIIESMQYKKIVEFTRENQLNANIYSASDIDGCYCQLVGDIYDIFVELNEK